MPKTISDSGRTLTLADVRWSNSTQAGADGTVTHYTATARYTLVVLYNAPVTMKQYYAALVNRDFHSSSLYQKV